MTGLANLEELVHRCSRDSSKEYIREAVVCYEAGAFRSAIVATWIAVFFDILEKLKELGIGGDAAAQGLIQKFETAQLNSSISGLMAFERNILREIKDKVQLIGEMEYLSLSRIQSDRNRCAHPTFGSGGDIFKPSAELARLHIVNAISEFMRFPPTVGKAVLEDVTKTIESRLFPANRSQAIIALEATGLKYPRKSLLRSVVLLSLKHAISADSGRHRWAYVRAKLAIMDIHRRDTLEVMESELTNQARKAADDELGNLIWFLHSVSEAANFLSDDVWQKLSLYVRQLPGSEITDMEVAFQVKRLSKDAILRIGRLKFEEIKAGLYFGLDKPFRDRLLELLEHAESFQIANNIVDFIEQYINDFQPDEKEALIAVGSSNEQVAYSFSYKRLVELVSGEDQ